MALFLASNGQQEYRVAFKTETQGNEPCFCAEQNITANATCFPDKFEAENCSSVCAGAMCQFVKYTKSKDHTLFAFINLFGLYWGVFFFSAFGEMVLAGVFSQVKYYL